MLILFAPGKFLVPPKELPKGLPEPPVSTKLPTPTKLPIKAPIPLGMLSPLLGEVITQLLFPSPTNTEEDEMLKKIKLGYNPGGIISPKVEPPFKGGAGNCWYVFDMRLKAHVHGIGQNIILMGGIGDGTPVRGPITEVRGWGSVYDRGWIVARGEKKYISYAGYYGWVVEYEVQDWGIQLRYPCDDDKDLPPLAPETLSQPPTPPPLPPMPTQTIGIIPTVTPTLQNPQTQPQNKPDGLNTFPPTIPAVPPIPGMSPKPSVSPNSNPGIKSVFLPLPTGVPGNKNTNISTSGINTPIGTTPTITTQPDIKLPPDPSKMPWINPTKPTTDTKPPVALQDKEPVKDKTPEIKDKIPFKDKYPGGDLTPEPIKQPDAVTQKDPKPDDDCCEEILLGIDEILNRLGPKLGGYSITTRLEAIGYDLGQIKYFILAIWGASLHNALFLGTNVIESLYPMINKLFGTYFFQPQDPFTAGGKLSAIEAKVTHAQSISDAALNLPLLPWLKANESAITRGLSNVYWLILVALDNIKFIFEYVVKYISTIGNALLDNGIITLKENTRFVEEVDISNPITDIVDSVVEGDIDTLFVNIPEQVKTKLPNTVILYGQQIATRTLAKELIEQKENALKQEDLEAYQASVSPDLEIDDIWGDSNNNSP